MTTVLTPSTEGRKIYECTVLLSPLLSPEELLAAVRRVEEEVAELNGAVVERDLWGRRGLAYLIGGHREGNFAVLYVEVEPDRVGEFEKALRLLKPVLRHLMVKVPPRYAPPRFSVLFEEWKKERKRRTEREREQREEVLRKEIVRKVAAPRAPEPREARAPAMTDVDLEKRLEEIISDEGIRL